MADLTDKRATPEVLERAEAAEYDMRACGYTTYGDDIHEQAAAARIIAIHFADLGPSTAVPTELRTPDEWSELLGAKIMDPDGWRRGCRLGEKPWDEKISYDEFAYRRLESTQMFHASTADEDRRKARAFDQIQMHEWKVEFMEPEDALPYWDVGDGLGTHRSLLEAVEAALEARDQ